MNIERFNHNLGGRAENRITDEWVIMALTQFVKLGSFADYEDRVPLFREVPREEVRFNPNSLERNLIRPRTESEDVADKILSILLNGNFRRGNLELINRHRESLHGRISRRTMRAERLQIILPGFPFKDQNPLTTRHSLDFVDLGEYLFMAQTRDIIESVRAVYPPGLKFAVLTDGLVHADIFANGERERIRQYSENFQAIRDIMGLKDVEIMDMSIVVEAEGEFLKTQRNIRDTLVRLQRDSGVVKRYMRSLRWGVLVNISGMGYGYNDFKNFLKIPEEELPREVFERINESSLEYASFSLTMSYLNCVGRYFPDALRATVHPKDAAQIPLHLVNRSSQVFPYNGVPVVSESKLASAGSIKRATRILRYCDVLQHEDAIACFLPGQNEPFYYTVKEHKAIL